MQRLAFCLFLLWITCAQAWAQAAGANCSPHILAVEAAPGAGGEDGKPNESTLWKTVTLPNTWNAFHVYPPGNTIWYRITWERGCPQGQIEPVALLVSHVAMAGEVFVNGNRLWADAQLTEPLSRSWNMARVWTLPDSWLRDGVNTLWVRAISTPGESLGLGGVHLGERQAMLNLRDDLQWRGRTLFQINAIIACVVAALLFSVWLMNREQTDMCWYALMLASRSLNSYALLTTSTWPWSSALTVSRIATVSLLLSAACFCLFLLRFAAQKLPRTERAMWTITALLLALQWLAPAATMPIAGVLGIAGASLICFSSCFHFFLHTLRTRQIEHILLSICLLFLLSAWLFDATMIFQPAHEQRGVSPYVAPIFTLFLCGTLSLRLSRQMRRIERFSQDLQYTVSQTRNELTLALKREHDLALNNTRLQDRLQLAHDLHDGAGGSLAQIISLIGQSDTALNKQKVLSMLQFVQNDLRLTIDSNADAAMTAPTTPRAWMAPIRRRYLDLFDELGISLDCAAPEQWRVQPNEAQCLTLTRLAAEALTNIIKHSRARHAQVALQLPETGEVILHIEDDGIGFDVESSRQTLGIGMRSMRARLARLGGSLEVDSRPGQTVMTARLPASATSRHHPW